MNRILDPRRLENLSTIGQLDYHVCRWKRAISKICNSFLYFSLRKQVSFVRKAVVGELENCAHSHRKSAVLFELSTGNTRHMGNVVSQLVSNDNPGIPVRTEREESATYPHCIPSTSPHDGKN